MRYKVPKEIEKIVSSCLPGNILLKCLVEDEEEVCVLEEEGIEGRE